MSLKQYIEQLRQQWHCICLWQYVIMAVQVTITKASKTYEPAFTFFK